MARFEDGRFILDQDEENPFAGLQTVNPARFKRLSLREMCAYYCAMTQNPPLATTVVAIASGLNAGSLSYLRRCREPSSTHYSSVRREIERMGESAFWREYSRDPDVLAKLRAAQIQWDETRRTTPLGERKPDKRADKYCREYLLTYPDIKNADGTRGVPVSLEVAWRDDIPSSPPGFYYKLTFIHPQPPAVVAEHGFDIWLGDKLNRGGAPPGKPLRTSFDARNIGYSHAGNDP